MSSSPNTKKSTEPKPIKYSDKSAGQPELVVIFDELKKLLTPYVKGHLVLLGDQPSQYSIGSDKVVNLFGRDRDIYFSGLLVQKGYVGFYFMPVYTNPSLVKELHPDLAKCLKGKSCFHIKKNDPTLRAHIKDALKLGYDDYKKKGWI